MSTIHTAYATCERCQETASLSADAPYPDNYPDGWVEGVYDPTEQRTYAWCCETCSRILLGPTLRMNVNGQVVSSIDAIDYVCPFCLSHATMPFCPRCNGIVYVAYLPLGKNERIALEQPNGLQLADESTLAGLAQRGIISDSGTPTPLGLSLQVLLQGNPSRRWLS